MSMDISKLLSDLSSEDNWPKVETLLRKSCAVIIDEFEKSPLKVKIDVLQAVNDLSRDNLKSPLVNFFVWNHRFVELMKEKNRRAAIDTYNFIDEFMPNATFNVDQMAVIKSKRDEILKLDGSILDLGVYKGWSTRGLASIFPDKLIHGFDSFEGLPEDWAHVLKGAFGDVKGLIPELPENIRLYKGWFKDTLPVWFENNNKKPISLLRIDCDIYSSTKTIFDSVGSLVQSGTWIFFDELIGYRGWENHEYKAFTEFKEKTKIEFEYVAYGLTFVLGHVK